MPSWRELAYHLIWLSYAQELSSTEDNLQESSRDSQSALMNCTEEAKEVSSIDTFSLDMSRSSDDFIPLFERQSSASLTPGRKSEDSDLVLPTLPELMPMQCSAALSPLHAEEAAQLQASKLFLAIVGIQHRQETVLGTIARMSHKVTFATTPLKFIKRGKANCSAFKFSEGVHSSSGCRHLYHLYIRKRHLQLRQTLDAWTESSLIWPCDIL